jgi:hypothetical protein
MRGRAAEIADAGAYGWEVVWEALKTVSADEASDTLTGELGLGGENEIQQDSSDMPATEFSGTRKGRSVALRIGVVRSGLRGGGLTEVEISGAVPPFRVSADGERLVAAPGAPPAVEELIAGLQPSAAWKKAAIEGGQDGILARRPVTAHPQGYVYDLWLVERLADRLGA